MKDNLKSSAGTVKVGLIQINNSFSGQNYFPYSVGVLQAYAQKHLTNKKLFEFGVPVYKRIPVKNAVQAVSGSGIVFFSVYTWNIKISLEIARRLKLKSPGTLVVFGGPEVPLKRIEAFLKKHRFVDIACHGEGEKAFLGILESLHSRDWACAPNISWLSVDGMLMQSKPGNRITDLNELGSPYLDGVFKPLMRANPKENWVALWETNRGCPFSCSYCVWGASTEKKVCGRFLDDLYREIDWFSNNKIEFIFCCDANFGILPRDMEIVRYMARNKKKYGYPKVFSVQNTKNSTERIYAIYKVMAEAGLSKGVSLALQSINPATLKSIRRENISIGAYNRLQKIFNAEKIETFTDIILGLPDETYSSFVNGVSKIIANGQHNRIQFINLSILTNSEMDDAGYQRKFGIKTAESRLINIHGSLNGKEEILEKQKLVVATRSMPKKDWVKTRVFSWFTALLHFNKLLQVPFVVLNNAYAAEYGDLISIFADKSPSQGILGGINKGFRAKAEHIQAGGHEYSWSKEWLNIWWPLDELTMIEICAGKKLDEFYDESLSVLSQYCKKENIPVSQKVLEEAILLNKNLLKLPFNGRNLKLDMEHNIWQVYQAGLSGEKLPLKSGRFGLEIDRASQKWASWEDWCREVVWYGNKRGAYLYHCTEIDS